MSEHDKQPDPPASERTGKRPRHEGDEPIAQRDEQEPRSVGKQGHRDLERGVEDTDLRGGGEYQERTQNDQHANENSQQRQHRDKDGGTAARKPATGNTKMPGR